MTRKRLAVVVALALGMLGGHTAEAQPASKVHRIGFLRFGEPPPTYIEGFRQGLREFGYLEGQNITIEYGVARNAAQLPEIAAELVRRKVDVLVASGTRRCCRLGTLRARSRWCLWPPSIPSRWG